ncbi:MAG: acyltransferase family protein [Chitinophagales bacterium]
MKKYFKNLDTLRAIAALIVVIGHIEILKANFLIKPLSFIRADGHKAVVLFFVLSGFLITYLLLEERTKYKKIDFKKFYMRRVLRIWPLYYFVFFLSYFLFADTVKPSTFILCLTIFPNLAHAFGVGWAHSPQIWSIGVEEQFYLLWPLILFLFSSRRKLLIFSIIFFIGYSLLPHVLGFINVRTLNSENIVYINRFFYSTKFNCMMIGCLIAILYHQKNSVLTYLCNKYVMYIFAFIPFLLWFTGVQFKYFTDEIYSVFFGLMILNLAANENFKINFDNVVTKFLGKISYGIYMYHWIVILLVFKFIDFSLFKSSFISNLILYTLVLSITILIATLSYYLFEKRFLNIKKKYEK